MFKPTTPVTVAYDRDKHRVTYFPGNLQLTKDADDMVITFGDCTPQVQAALEAGQACVMIDLSDVAMPVEN